MHKASSPSYDRRYSRQQREIPLVTPAVHHSSSYFSEDTVMSYCRNSEQHRKKMCRLCQRSLWRRQQKDVSRSRFNDRKYVRRQSSNHPSNTVYEDSNKYTDNYCTKSAFKPAKRLRIGKETNCCSSLKRRRNSSSLFCKRYHSQSMSQDRTKSQKHTSCYEQYHSHEPWFYKKNYNAAVASPPHLLKKKCCFYERKSLCPSYDNKHNKNHSCYHHNGIRSYSKDVSYTKVDHSSRHRHRRRRQRYYQTYKPYRYSKRQHAISHSRFYKAKSPTIVTSHQLSQKKKKKNHNEIVHFDWCPGMHLSERFIVRSQLGQGTFGRVLECKDCKTKEHVAVKVVRDVSRYTSAAKIEAEILNEIKKKDPERKAGCVCLLDYFLYDAKKGRVCYIKRSRHRHSSSDDDNHSSDESTYKPGIHMCLAFERLGLSLFAFLSQNSYRGYFLEDIQKIAKETLKALAFLRDIKLTHTDLKPENILFVNSESRVVELLRARHPPRFWDGDATDSSCSSCSHSSSVSTTHHDHYSSNRNGGGSILSQRKKMSDFVYTKRPFDCRVKLIDFGGATFEDDDHCSLINTRQYRAPEVILQTGWSTPSDMWSLGCVLMELYTGVLLFKTHDHMEHLALIERIIGPIPKNMLRHAASTDASKYLRNIDYNNEIRLNWPEGAMNQKSLRHVGQTRYIEEMVLPCHKLFAQFVKYLLTIDPNLRPTPQRALRHRFFSEIFPEY